MRNGWFSLRLVICLAVGVGMVGCGGERRPPGVAFDAGSGMSHYDSGPMRDSGAQDAGPRDAAATDAAQHDSGLSPDAGALVGCEYDVFNDLASADIGALTGVDNAGRTVSTAGGSERIAIAYGKDVSAVQDIFLGVAPNTTDAPLDPSQVTSDFATSLTPNVAYVAGNWLVAWADNLYGNYEISVRSYDLTRDTATTAVRLTENSDRDEAPTVIANGDGALLAWVEEDSLFTRHLRTLLLSSTGSALGSANEVASSSDGMSGPVATGIGENYGVGWIHGTDALLVKLNEDGNSATEPESLITDSNGAGELDLVGTSSGGAAVFNVLLEESRQEIHFRTFDEDGAPTGVERNITTAPERGTGASIAAYAGGFLVSYRALADDGLEEPQLRVALLSERGELLGRVSLVDVDADGSQTSIDVSEQGTTIVVAWVDGLGSRTARWLRFRCGE